MSPTKRTIEVVDYDPRWPEAFAAEARALSAALAEPLVRVHHIGSTAVPGLKAKPVIDILLEVRSVGDLDACEPAMRQLDYVPMGEHGIPGRRFFLKGPEFRTHHVHAFRAGSPEVRRHLAFRDYLVAHPATARDYEALKAACAASCGHDNDTYCDGKNDFVSTHEKKALEWMAPAAAAGLPLRDPPADLGHGQVRLRFVAILPGDEARGFVPAYHFRILNGEGAEVGHIHFRVGDTEHVRISAGHIGFEIRPDFRGRGYAGEACRALAPFVRSLRASVWITCDPDNKASARTIERLGATFVDEVAVPAHDPHFQRGSRRKRRYCWAP